MDNETLKQLAQFRILLKRDKGVAIDFERFVGDTAYARQILALAEDSENETLVVLALTLHDKFGLLKAAGQALGANPATPDKTDKTSKTEDERTGRYLFGARS